MKKALFCTLLLLTAAMLPACKEGDKPAAASGKMQQQAATPSDTDALSQAEAKQPFVPVNDSIGWEYETGKDNNGTPNTKIYLNYRGVKYRAATGIGYFKELPKSDYGEPQYAVPQTALTATTGFWEGIQQTCYVGVENNFLVIYRRSTDAKDKTGHDAVFEPVMKLDLKSTTKPR
ncbi:hypothetical protein B6N25_08850 [Sphingobacteriales bacterium TSM_CSS]|nr:hypothetical protein B6N25_08850 [Sphingobacteriales bacterium TSM_CSS]